MIDVIFAYCPKDIKDEERESIHKHIVKVGLPVAQFFCSTERIYIFSDILRLVGIHEFDNRLIDLLNHETIGMICGKDRKDERYFHKILNDIGLLDITEYAIMGLDKAIEWRELGWKWIITWDGLKF